MKLRVKDVDLSTGGPFIAVLNEEDARKLDLHALDRIKITREKKSLITVVDIAVGKNIKTGEIGLFEETLANLNVKNGNMVDIFLQTKPKSIDYVKKKLMGKKLSKEEIDQIIHDVVENKLSEIELTYFVSACYINKLDMNETIALINAIVKSGSQLKIDKYPIVDKHSSGGIPGNRTTMIIVPIIAVAGLTIPKTSSRAITSPSGTADTMEVLAPVSLSVEKIKEVVKKTNGCIVWGGAMELASADDHLIKIEYPLRLDPENILVSSILAKKAAVNSSHVLLEIPVGKGAKIGTRKRALHIKKLFTKLAKKLGIKIKIILTEGDTPIGKGIGPNLEARDVLYVLENNEKAPQDLKEKSVHMAGLILKMVGKGNQKIALEILESGKAHEKMKEIIRAQGGNPNIKSNDIKLGNYSYIVKARKEGTVKNINNEAINKIARIAGAPNDKEAGIYLEVQKGDEVKKEDPLFIVYSKNSKKLNYTLDVFRSIKVIEIS